jgi:hypothetical protein
MVRFRRRCRRRPGRGWAECWVLVIAQTYLVDTVCTVWAVCVRAISLLQAVRVCVCVCGRMHLLVLLDWSVIYRPGLVSLFPAFRLHLCDGAPAAAAFALQFLYSTFLRPVHYYVSIITR